MLQAGTSIQVITPPLGHPMVGFFHRREAATVADDLTARTLVLDDGSARIAIVVCDLLSFKAELVGEVRARIGAMCEIPPGHVMISCTHTHTGPATTRHRGDDPNPAYVSMLVQRIADGVRIAETRLQPALIATGRARVEGVCFNRRFHMKDGTVVFNPGVGNPNVVGPAGPVDPEVVALLVESAEGVPLALWSCLSTHYAGTDEELAISADYYGVYADAVARSLGDQCVGLHANGTSGDINTVDVGNPDPLRGMANARRIGDAVAATAIQAVMAQPRQEDVTLGALSEQAPVRRWPVSPDDVATAHRLLEAGDHTDPLPAGSFSYLVGQPIPAYQVEPYAHGIVDLAGMPEQRDVEVQVFRIGDLAIVGMPGEVFVEFGLRLKDGSPVPHTAVMGLTNGAIGYLPTERAFAQGGYETWRGDWSWTDQGTGERLVEVASGLLERLVAQASSP